ncbi:hypothetical protein JXA63_03505 [Candidatus Woesebacteria bacterium]|nr:hypothetical protein [Candidatus Woesebacteria bacterium]
MPKTQSGKWSVGLIAVMPILLRIGMSFTDTLYESVSAGGTLFEDIIKRLVLALTMLSGIACGVSAFITGVLAIVKKKERSISVYLATFIGALFTLFLLGEFLFPH